MFPHIVIFFITFFVVFVVVKKAIRHTTTSVPQNLQPHFTPPSNYPPQPHPKRIQPPPQPLTPENLQVPPSLIPVPAPPNPLQALETLADRLQLQFQRLTDNWVTLSKADKTLVLEIFNDIKDHETAYLLVGINSTESPADYIIPDSLADTIINSTDNSLLHYYTPAVSRITEAVIHAQLQEPERTIKGILLFNTARHLRLISISSFIEAHHLGHAFEKEVADYFTPTPQKL